MFPTEWQNGPTFIRFPIIKNLGCMFKSGVKSFPKSGNCAKDTIFWIK